MLGFPFSSYASFGAVKWLGTEGTLSLSVHCANMLPSDDVTSAYSIC
jgi:hypothetical protein